MGVRRFIALIICFTTPIFPTIFAGEQPEAHPDDICAGKKCRSDGPVVKFPFVLKGKQPEYCGYNSSYNLYCDKMNRTIMDLPSSLVKVVVTNIDYWSRLMRVQSLENCFAKQLRDIDISTTPFWYPPFRYPPFQYPPFRYPPFRKPLMYEIDQYTLFNCSALTENCTSLIHVPCLDSHGYKVCATRRYREIDYSGQSLESCTKLYDTKLIPAEILDSKFLNLTWSFPGQIGCCRGGKEGENEGGTEDHSGTWKKVFKILCISGAIIRCLLLILTIGAIYLACFTKKRDTENHMRLKKFLADYTAMKPTRYSYADIKKMTNGFKEKLGEGGYGNVFKGKVANRVLVAVKLLHNASENGEEFINEVGTMGSIHHVNVVRMLGFCADGYRRALVYEFLPNGSLDKFILQDGHEHRTLQMGRLQDIAIGIARGMEYLHQGCEQRILHFDIKPHNILLDENYNPKISDFGLAKLCEKGRSAVSMTAARGTMGYIAPEVFSRHFGNVSYKSDIYSFGMLLLEMVGQRKNIDATVKNISQVYFPEWVYGRLANGEELRVQVEEDGEDQIAKKLAIVGLWCIQWKPLDRPSISFVLQMLEGSGENLKLSPNPFTSDKSNNLANPSEHRALGSALAVISES